MDKWLKDILPDKDPYHNRGRDQMRKKRVRNSECLWFSPASSTTKTGRHDIAVILLKVALNTKNQKSNHLLLYLLLFRHYKYNSIIKFKKW